MDFNQESQSLNADQPGKGTVSVGDILDERYQLVEIVGRGGYGLVFRATDLNLQRDVAVKVLSLEGVNESDTLKRFEQEGQILRRLHAQNTVFFYDCGQTPQHLPYIVMEFVSGQQLKDLIEKEGKIPPKRTVAILVQVFAALAEAHSYGFIHRDLKPSNIMLCHRPGFPDDFVKVLDFGIAKIISDDDIDISKGDMAGTPKYMPPEQFKNETLTPLADLYSMGCIAYEMLTGIAPFDGETLHVTVAKHLFMTPKSFDPSIEQYPNLVATIFKLLEKHPESRFDSAQHVIEVLEHWNEPTLIPELEGCRLKGDDVRGSSFYEDEVKDSSSEISRNLLCLTNSQLVEPSPIQIAQLEAQQNQPSQFSIFDFLSRVDKKIWFITGGIAVTVMIVIGVALSLSGSPETTTELSASSHTFVEPVVVPESTIDPVLIEIAANSAIDSSVSATALGLQTNECLTHLDDILYGLDIPETKKKAVPVLQNSKDSDASPSNSKSRRKHSHNSDEKENDASPKESNDSDASQLRFTLNYSPKTAKVGFLNAFGQCRDGVCTLEMTSENTPARIVISAPGYVSRNLLIKEKVSNLQVDLVAETDSN